MESHKPDWEAYEREISRVSELFRGEVEGSSKGAYEYGVLLIKHLMLLNGGALVALPAIASVLPEVAKNNVPNAAFFFVVGLILAFVTGYFAHLNWLLQSSSYLERRDRRFREITYAHLGQNYQDINEIEEDRAKTTPFKRLIWWTFILPHITGIASLSVLFFGCFQLF